MKNPVLITGGCGFLGCHLAVALRRKGEKVVLFDNLSRVGSRENLAWLRNSGTFEFIRGSTLNGSSLKETVRRYRPKGILHLAGQVAMTTSVRDPWSDFQLNVVGTLNLLECLRLHSPGTALLYASSNKVYGALSTVRLVERSTRYVAPDFPRGLDESLPLDFRTPYGCSKGAADQYVLEYARTYGLRAAVFRHSTIYGGHQHATFDQGWVGWFCQKAWEQKKMSGQKAFTISGSGKQVRDLLHVDDASRCYLEGLRDIHRIFGQAFNVGGGMENSSSVLELFSVLESLLGVKLRFKKIPWRHEDQRFFVADTQKCQKSLHWSPKISKITGLEYVLDWVSGGCRFKSMRKKKW